jgi:hypothetical protein
MSRAPGQTEIHHAESRYSRPSWIMPPHDGVGGWIPSPRKDRVASSTIARASSSVATTIKVDVTFGRMWRMSTRGTDPPRARIALTKSRWRSDSTWDRSTRA